MVFLTILAVSISDIVLCIVEIPKLITGKLIRELVVFSVLLITATAYAVLAALDVDVPNLSDLFKWVYKPLSGFMQSMLKP